MASEATPEPQPAAAPPTPREVLEAQLLLARAKKGKSKKKLLKASHAVSADDGNASDKENEPGNNDGKEDVIQCVIIHVIICVLLNSGIVSMILLVITTLTLS